MHATIVAEDFAGMRSQGRGLAERAGFTWDFQPVYAKKKLIAHLPVRFWPLSPALFAPIHLSPATRLIISIGGKGGVAGAALGRQHRLPVVQIQNPRIKLDPYSLVIANQHDCLTGPDVLSVRTAMHDVTPGRLAQAAQRWQGPVRKGAETVLGVLLGGSNGRYRLAASEARALADRLAAMIARTGSRCVLTPSRRTSPQAISILREVLTPLGAEVMEGEGEQNPYMGLLACCDALAVTQDSVSMVSEAVATEKPVCILPLKGHSRRIERFINTLEKAGRIQSGLENISFAPCRRLDDTSLAAEEIHRRIRFSQEG